GAEGQAGIEHDGALALIVGKAVPARRYPQARADVDGRELGLRLAHPIAFGNRAALAAPWHRFAREVRGLREQRHAGQWIFRIAVEHHPQSRSLPAGGRRRLAWFAEYRLLEFAVGIGILDLDRERARRQEGVTPGVDPVAVDDELEFDPGAAHFSPASFFSR